MLTLLQVTWALKIDPSGGDILRRLQFYYCRAPRLDPTQLLLLYGALVPTADSSWWSVARTRARAEADWMSKSALALVQHASYMIWYMSCVLVARGNTHISWGQNSVGLTPFPALISACFHDSCGTRIGTLTGIGNGSGIASDWSRHKKRHPRS